MTGYVNIRDCGRNSHPIPSPNRAVSLRLCLCAIALVLLLAPVASGQILEGQITLPDTLGPLNGPYCIACTDDSAFPRLYVGGTGGFYPGRPPEDSGGVIVAEALTCKRLARIPTGPVKALCYVPIHNKLYVAKLNTDSVEVVDCATNQVVTAVLVAGEVPVIQYNSQNDRLYCGGNSTTVIDCDADTVIHTIAFAATVFGLDSIRNKLYVGRNGPLLVIDCAADTVVATIPEISLDSALCFNPTAGKMYAPSGDTLYAIRTDGDSVVARLAFSGLAPVLTCDPQRNRVYCANGGNWSSVDCAADTVLLTIGVGQTASFMACNVAQDRLFLTVPNYCPEVAVYDATTGQWLKDIWQDGIPSGAGWCSGLDRLYGLPALQTNPPAQSCLLTAVIGTSDSMVGFVPLTMRARSVSVDTVHNILYFMYPGGTVGCIGIADCSRNVVAAYTYAGNTPGPMCYDPNNDRLYWSTASPYGDAYSMKVYDCATNKVVGDVPMDGEVQAVRLHQSLNKLYVSARDALGNVVVEVLDCSGDTVEKRIVIPDDRNMKFVLVPEDNRLWLLNVAHVVVIDCLTDSVVADAIDNLGSIDDACACPEDRKIFSGWGDGPSWIIDMDNPVHVETLQTVWDDGMRFCYVPNAHKVYWCANYGDPYPGHSVFRVIDSRTNAITATFGAQRQVSGMCLDHTGGYVYCTGYEDSVLLVIDTRADSVAATVRLPSLPTGPPVLNSQTNRIYAAQYRVSNDIPVIRDSMLIGLEELRSGTRPLSICPTLASRSVPLRSTTPAQLFDATGRRVAALRRGLNDISRLAPGIYFVHEEPQAAGRKPQAVRKVVVAR